MLFSPKSPAFCCFLGKRKAGATAFVTHGKGNREWVPCLICFTRNGVSNPCQALFFSLETTSGVGGNPRIQLRPDVCHKPLPNATRNRTHIETSLCVDQMRTNMLPREGKIQRGIFRARRAESPLSLFACSLRAPLFRGFSRQKRRISRGWSEDRAFPHVLANCFKGLSPLSTLTRLKMTMPPRHPQKTKRAGKGRDCSWQDSRSSVFSHRMPWGAEDEHDPWFRETRSGTMSCRFTAVIMSHSQTDWFLNVTCDLRHAWLSP